MQQDREDLSVRVNCSREEGEEKQFVCLLLDPIPLDPMDNIPIQSSKENRFEKCRSSRLFVASIHHAQLCLSYIYGVL